MHYASLPKSVTLDAATWNPMDYDGLVAACKPIVDGLVDAGVLHVDGPRSGHTIEYRQHVDRTRRGVTVTVEVKV